MNGFGLLILMSGRYMELTYLMYIYIYTYIYICLCVCVCVCALARVYHNVLTISVHARVKICVFFKFYI